MRAPRPNTGQAFALIAMLGIVAGSYWLRSSTRTTASPAKTVQPPPHADYYARNARITVMGANGAPLYILNTVEVMHYPNDSADMDGVSLRYLGNRPQGDRKGNWKLQARHGHRPPGNSQRVRLTGHVVADGTTARGVPLTLHTPALTVFMQDHRLATQSPVRVDSEKRTITAVGMNADLKTDEIHFLKDVHAQFTP